MFLQTNGVRVMTSRKIWGCIGVVILIIVWWLFSLLFSDLVIASPLQTGVGLLRLLNENEFWGHFGITLYRFVVSLFLGALMGLVLGIWAGFEERVKWLLEPLNWILMTLPPVVLVMVSMIWFGMGSLQTIFVTSLLIFPLIYANTIAGIKAIDEGLIEMAQVYHASHSQMIRQVYLPGVYGPLFAAMGLSAGMGIRIVVLAEVLGASKGIGHAFSLARANIDTPALFAWILVCLFLGGGINGLLFAPLKRHLQHWREQE
ncbi:NitT/TauT family transport system permease protein [Cohaesibacter marisflavi]|uniref:NitT/TauT family transport system permease protein n=1 Tax=Cohaesibacter marisflavi TaxID=655353 RepID=A0A1I5M8E5_9HYPH|nr:ABC transporter permease subunit [Cohaesibacter marisflavi]SFP05795.1 NitT/TauT family transport system permease protein [Cohaesibacter marisflavi]